MSAVSVTIGADTSQFDAAVNGLPAKVNQVSSSLNKVATSSGGGLRNIGAMSLQFQDIAIQAQMGARWSTIIAQQGSQMLSVFGPAGMIAGGVVAIGGAFVTMGQSATDAFNAAKNSAADFESKVTRVLAIGSGGELINTLDEISSRIRTITTEMEGLNSMFGVAANIADIFGGPSVEERMNLGGEQMQRSGEQFRETLDRMMQVSEQQTELAEMRARGETEAANQMERQIKLGQELTRIQTLNIPRSAKAQLINDAQRRFVAEAPQEQFSGNLLTRPLDLFSSKFSQVAAPILNAVKQQITEQAGKLQSNAQSLQRAAFSPLQGDTDVSFGRAASINPLTSGASAQIQQMMRQSALLKTQAEKIDISNTLLGDIAETVKKQRFTLSYN